MWKIYRDREINGKVKSRKDAGIFESSVKENLLQGIGCFENEKLYVVDDQGESIPPYACDFCTAPGSEYICLVADEEGFVTFFDTSPSKLNITQSLTKKSTRWRCHNNAVFDIAWVPRSNRFVTASGDTTAALWDATAPEECLNIFYGHTGTLKSVCVSSHCPHLVATGSRDGNVFIWDTRFDGSQPSIRIPDAHATYDALTPKRKRRRLQDESVNSSRQTVTSVVFQESNTLITCGAMDGIIKLWDLRSLKLTTSTAKTLKSSNSTPFPKEAIPYSGNGTRRRGYSCLTLDSTRSQLFALCTDDVIYEYNLSNSVTSGSRAPTKRYTGHFSNSFDVRIALSPDDLFLLCGSDEAGLANNSGLSQAYIWKTNKDDGKPSFCLKSPDVHQVASVSWCPSDWTRLVTCSDACAVTLWRLTESTDTAVQVGGRCEKIEPHSEAYQLCEGNTFDNSASSSFMVLRHSPAPSSPPSPLVARSPPQKSNQASLNRWLFRRSSLESGSDISLSTIDQNVQNKTPTPKRGIQKISPAKPSTSKQVDKQKRSITPRKTLSNITNQSPGKIEFKSTKPNSDQRKNKGSNITMEEYFLSKG